VWQNIGSIAAVQWGYAFKNSVTKDISGMSPASYSLNTSDGELVTVTGLGTGQAGADTVIVYRTEHGGAIFYYAGELANPGDGNTWTFNDNVLDADLNLEIQAQVHGIPLRPGVDRIGQRGLRIERAGCRGRGIER